MLHHLIRGIRRIPVESKLGQTTLHKASYTYGYYCGFAGPCGAIAGAYIGFKNAHEDPPPECTISEDYTKQEVVNYMTYTTFFYSTVMTAGLVSGTIGMCVAPVVIPYVLVTDKFYPDSE